MGGKDSSRAAPNEDDGLNGLMPPKPVCWRCSGAAAPPAEDIEMDGAPVEFVTAVAPVGCVESEEKSESENVEPEVVLDVGCDASGAKPPALAFCVAPVGFDESNANDVATLAMIVWLFAVNVIYAVDSLIWSHTVARVAYVWCDICTCTLDTRGSCALH